MDNVRFERRIFIWDYNKGGDNWSNKISIILNIINCMQVSSSSSLSILFVNKDGYVHNLDKTVLFLAIYSQFQ